MLFKERRKEKKKDPEHIHLDRSGSTRMSGSACATKKARNITRAATSPVIFDQHKIEKRERGRLTEGKLLD